MSYSSSLPRERERYVDRTTEREVYPEQSFLSSGRQPIQYTERTVRYKDESSGLWGFLLSHKFLIASLLLGLLFFTSMNSHDIDSHYYRDRGILDRTSSGIHSFGDRVSDGFNSIRDKIFPRRSMTDRLYDNVRGSAYDAKGRLIDGVDSLSSGAADVRDRVSGGLSYLGDKIRGTAEDARDSIYDTMYDSHAKVRRAGRGVSDRLYDTKDRLMDRFDDDYEYVRRPMRRARRSMNRSWRSHSSWSVMDMIAEHPILSTLLGLLLFFSLKPLFSSSHSSSSHRSGGIVNSLMTPRRTTLTGLALIMDKIGSFLAFLGDKVRASDNFSDMRSNRGTYNFDRSSEYARDFNSQPVSSSSSDMYRSDNIDTRGSSIDTRDSNIESSSRFSHVPVRDHTSSSVRDQSVLNSSLSSGVSSSASTRSDMLGHTAPSAEYGTSSITSTQSSTSNNNTWPKLSDSSKFKEASTADIIKSEGQARPTIGGR